MLVDGFRSTGNVRVFEDGWTKEAAVWGPYSIAGTLVQLSALPPVHSLRNALIVLVRPNEPSLAEEDRDRLWRAFRVPVFEQRIDGLCNLLAAECEAHDGLHLESPAAIPREGEMVETAMCGCGRTTPRLIAPERETLRKVAAYAR